MDEIFKFIKYVFKSKLLILGFIIYFSFNISALKTHWFDYFFFGSSIHYCCKGLDFYQIPNGMYAFLNGGDLSGKLPAGVNSYSYPYASNSNVYHPFLTIILGFFFIIFDPEVSINLWFFIKIFITLLTAFYIYKNFKDNKYLNLAIFLFLINFSQYNEIKISQYQFLFNIFLLFFLINLTKKKNSLGGGVLYFLTLIAKPIGLLWMPVLFLKKKISLLLSGLSLFLISTLTFSLLGVGQYFTDNVLYHLFHPMNTKNIDFMSFEAILRNSFNLSMELVRAIKIAVLGFIYLLALSKRISVIVLVYLLVLFFLFFYDLVFQYHFSVLGPLLAICLLSLDEFQSKAARILILIINLPNTFFIFRLLNIGVISSPVLGTDPTFKTQQIVSFFQLLPIILLTIIVIFPHIKTLFQKFNYKYVSV
ncbi:MAG: hypothetical protein HYW63_00655 [Candidatus Levybacteria bacterium]|nr:hypothetical protein [Candidatus Levybacteria bacterium]